MPGERPPTLPRDLQPCQIASSLGCPSQHPCKDRDSASRATQSMRDDSNKAQAQGSPEAQAKEVEQEHLLLRTQAPAGQSCVQAYSWLASRMESRMDPPLQGLSISRIRCIQDEPPKDLQHEAPQVSETKAPRVQKTRARRRPSIPRSETLPSPEKNSSQRCFQGAPSSFTSTNGTSPSATPGPLPQRAPQSSGTSPHRPASGPNLQAIGTNSWPPAAENSFPGANFGVPSAEPKPFPEGSRPSSPQGVSVPYPFPIEMAQHEQAAETELFTFHQPLVAWSEEALGTNPAYSSLPCNPGQSQRTNIPSDLGGALSPSGAAHLVPSPFHDSLHKSLTKGLSEGLSPTRDGLGNPRPPPNPPPQRHFPGQAYGANGVGTSPAPLDTQLPTSGPPPTTHLPQLWDSTAAPYPTSSLGPAVAVKTAFFESQQLCLPQSPPVPWPPVLTTPGPNSHQMGVLSQLTFPQESSEWQGDSQGALSALNTIPRPRETLSAPRSSPGQPNSSPRLLAYGGLKDSGTQPLFFGGTQPQVSPQGALSRPPPNRVVGASPSESPLPSPATNTASGSTCSSLSPPSGSPANPSSEDSQQPGTLRSSSFFLPPAPSQETSSPFPSPEPTRALPAHYQSESAKAFPLPTEGPGAEDAFKGLEGAAFPHKSPSLGGDRLQGFLPEPPPYSAQHFSLSTASLDQLDVLLTCRQCDRNYSSLAAFLEHRPLCSLLLAKTKDGSLQPSRLPTPTTTSKAPTDTHSGLLEQSQAAPFLLTRDDQGDSKDDSLRTSFLPGLAVAPFPLPTSDLDMEDDAKLDRLITEALNGMEYQSDNPEIDSSFIDVFADEEPSGCRGPSAGHPLNTQAGAVPKNGTQPQLPSRAAVPEPQAPCTGDRGYPARNRPKTRSLGLAPAEADATTLIKQQRRGKRFKLFRKDPGVTKGSNNPARAICLRPRKKGCGAEPQDRRSQARKSHADHSIPRATSKETRSSKHLHLPSGKDLKKRKGRSGSWSKELIHKIVQQKNRCHRRQTPRGQVSRVPPLTAKPPSTQKGGLKGQGCVSESEEEAGMQQQDSGGPAQGCSRHSRQRWRRGKKRKKEDLAQDPRKVMRQEAGEHREPPTPERTHSLLQSLDAPVEGGPEHTDHPTVTPKHAPQVLTTTKTQEENHVALGFPQEAKKTEVAAKLHPDTTELRERSGSPVGCGGESPRPAAPVPPQTGSPISLRSHPETLSGRSMPAPDADCLLGTSGCMKSPSLHAREDSSASQPGGCLVPTDKVADTFYTESSILVFKNSGPGCDPDHCDRNSVSIGCPAAKRGPLPNNDTPCDLFLGSKDPSNCFSEDLLPLATDTSPARSCYLGQDGMETLEAAPPKNLPYPVETDSGKVHSPLTLESTSLFAGLPEDGFDPPLYDSLSTDRVAHVPMGCTDTLPKKPLTDPLYPPFLLLDEVSPVLPGPFPDLSKGLALGKKCPFDQTVPLSPPPMPEKGSECSIALMNSLCEDDLEIKRLVTELESQLQGREGLQRALGEPEEAAREGRMDPSPRQASPLPTPQATSPHRDTLSATDLTGLEGSSSQQEGALETPQKQWPCLASCRTGKAAPPPGTQEDPGSGAPLSPAGFSLSFRTVQETCVSNTDSQVPLSGHLPDPNKRRAPFLHAESLARYCPNHELLFSKNEASGKQENAMLLPSKHTRGRSLDPCEAQGTYPHSPALEGFDSPDVHMALEPNLMLRADEGITSPPSASPSHDSEGHLEGPAVSPMGVVLTTPIAKDSGFKGESAPAGASLSTLQSGRVWSHPLPDPAWVPNAHLGQRPQDPVCCSFPLLLDAKAKHEDNVQDLQPGDPSVTGGTCVREGSSGVVKVSALPTDTQKKLRFKADGHLGSLGHSEKTKGQGQANRLRSHNWRSLGNPDTLTKASAHLQARPTRGRGACQGNRAARCLRNQALPSTSPTHPDGTSLVSILTASPLQVGPAERSPEKAASPQLLFSQESPDPSNRGLATCAFSANSPPTPTPCDLEPRPQEDPGTRVKPIGPPALSSYRDLPSPYHQPAYPVSAPLGKASHGQATKDAGPLATPPSLMTSYYGSEETLSHHSLLGARSSRDPPSHPLGPISFSAPVILDRDSPKSTAVRTLEDSGKEELRTSPAHETTPPPAGLSSPKMTVKADSLSSIPKDDLDSDERLRVLGPHCMRVPSISSPERTYSKDSSSESQSSTLCPSRREGQRITAVPIDLATLGPTGPDSQICQEDEAETSSKEQDNPGTPGARHCDVTKVPRACARGTPTGLHSALVACQSGTAPDFRSDSPQHRISVSPHLPQKDPFSPQEHKRRPRGSKKKPEPTEKTPAGLPMTCELCSACFRSRAGLSRHKARKHGPHREASSQPSPMAPPACQPPDPMAQAYKTPGKKSRKVPGKERPNQSPLGPSHSSGPPPLRASTAPEDTVGPEMLKVTRGKSEGSETPDTPLNQQVYTPGLTEQGKGARVPAPKPRRPDRWQAEHLHPNQAEMRGQRQGREPVDSPSHSERKSSRKAGKLRARGEKSSPGDTALATSDRHLSALSAPCGHCLMPLSLSPKGECSVDIEPSPPSPIAGPRALEVAADMGPRALCTEEMPAQKWRVCQGTIEKDHPVEQKAAWTRWFWGPGKARALDREPSQAVEGQPEENSRGAKGRSDGGIGKGTSDFPDSTPSLEVDSTTSSCPSNDPETLSGVQGPRGITPKAPSQGQREPPDLFDDDISFSQLFPLDGRLTQKKNLRVYGKRCKRPKCPPPKEPSPEVAGSGTLSSTRLPTDLSDSGSLCLSREEEDLCNDETMSLPESLLLDGLLSSKVPGLDPWTPSLSLWALESNREASYMEEEPSCFPENQDRWTEAIPQLHMVPAAWRDLELCHPSCETSSSLGDRSPEPPNLEREHDDRLPRNASLPPLYAKDFEVLSTQLEIQGLCFQGPCDDLADLPNSGILDAQSAANPQGPPNKRTEEASGARRAKGRDQPVRGRRACYKCKVCFQRFHSLGELDLHKLAHSPSPPPTCYMCVERRFSSRELLREHLWEKHVQGKAGPWACGMCLKEVADVWMYNQHLREHAARFARNGQALRALGDLPGCVEEESTLTHFLNSIVEQASKPQRTKRSIGKADREASEQEREAGKKTPRRRVKRKAQASVTPSQDSALTSLGGSVEGGSPPILTRSPATCSGSAKTPPTPSPDPWSHSEPLLQAVPVHEDCKDPSRDCHHCGKRFPKPFKLQRHLAVHSPQRVYLCPQCPQVYPEHWELRAHLGLTHGLNEERELPHMPLYACELCANVMHVIRRSFVCSSCNYTFAKKEQFDRHMDKHLRSGQQPFALRSVRRPGVPGRKTQVPRDVLPSKRHRVVVSPSPPEPSTDTAPSTSSPTASEGSLPALPLVYPETAPSPVLDQPSSQERPVDQAGHSLRGNNSPVNGQDLPPPSLSPFSASSAEDTGGCGLDRALEKPENEASLGSPEPCKWQTLLGEKRALHPFSRKHRSPGVQGKRAPARSPGDPSRLQAAHRLVPEGRTEGSSQKNGATNPGACSSSSKHRSAVPPSKALTLPAPLRKPIGMGTPASEELVPSPEDRGKPSTSKAKPRSSSQGSGGLQPGTQTGGGSQPQPASGQLQSEMASTPTEPSCPTWESSTPDPPQTHTKGSTRGPGEADHQGVQAHSSPREKREHSEKKRKGQALGLARHGSTGRAPSAADQSSRAPRKQATPSRVPPIKSRPSGQSGRTRPQPPAQRKGGLGHTSEKGSFPQARPLSRPYKRIRAVHGVEPMEPRDHRTAEAQSDLLSQLFGQKLTSFKIPLKKDNSQ